MAHYFMPGEPVTAQMLGDFMNDQADRDEFLIGELHDQNSRDVDDLAERIEALEKVVTELVGTCSALLAQLAGKAA
jgi:hypothetical protein